MDKANLLKQLLEAKERNPDRFDAVIKEHPDLWGLVVEEARAVELVAKAHADSPEGFFAYYEGKYGFEPPHQVKRWVKKIYEGHAKNLGFTLNGYRGSWKTVSISISFLEYRIGLEPWKSNLVIRASDITANEITDKVTHTIQFHPWWKKCFPNVVPDEESKWSTNGYWVQDTNFNREQWTEKTAGSADPTLVGGGYTSQKINGKHPTGVCLTDDLHGMNNSSSETERKAAVKFYTTELSKTFVRSEGTLITWPINIGVPWGKDDTHQTLKASGGYLSDEYPVMTRAPEGEGVYCDGVNELKGVVYEDIVGWWFLSNPKVFGVDDIKRDRGLGKFDFWQMMMVDFEAAKSGGLIYYSFPHKDPEGNRTIDITWPARGGCDPSFSFKERLEPERKNSWFGLGFGLKRPTGGAIIADGRLEQCTIERAATLIEAAQNFYPNWTATFVENVGMGLLFLETLRLKNPSLVLLPSDLGGIRMKGEKAGKAKNKWDRFKTEAASYLEDGTILISDEQNDFLDTLRDGLDNFGELDPNKPDKRWDAIDTVYHIIKSMPEVLVQKGAMKSSGNNPFNRKKVSVHPLTGMAGNRGY